jgi:hypothetical protein
MKLLQIGNPHPRNAEFIIRACKLFNIEYHQTNSTEPPDNQYDIIWSPIQWINPDSYPSSKIIFGPHFSVFPDPSSPLFTQSKPEHKERCIYTCLSDWNVKVHQEFTKMIQVNIPFIALPFGLEDIQPKQTTEYEYDCILYFKARHPSLLEFCESVVRAKGLRYKVYRYGSYQRQEYIETLKKTRFAIWIGSHESQGFGFQECLATNTPIFVYDVKSMKDEYAGNRFTYEHYKEQLLATTAGYWSDQCGKKVFSNEEFTAELDSFITNIPNYQPAAYVQQYLTDRVCFQRFLDALNISQEI